MNTLFRSFFALVLLFASSGVLLAQADPIVIFPPPGCPSSCYGCHSSVPGDCASRGVQPSVELMTNEIKASAMAKPPFASASKTGPIIVTNSMGRSVSPTAFFLTVPGLKKTTAKHGAEHPVFVRVDDPELVEKMKAAYRLRE